MLDLLGSQDVKNIQNWEAEAVDKYIRDKFLIV
jgi:hypothetical protein